MTLPSDDELIAYLDGEIDAGRRAELEQLLEASWEFRARLAQVEQDVRFFARAWTEAPAEAFPDFDTVWARAHRSNAPAGGLKPIVRSRPVWKIQSAAAVAAAAALAAFVWFSGPRTVSAQELMSRTARMEVRESDRIQNGIIYQKLRLQKRASAPYRMQPVVWEVWRSPSGGNFKETVGAGPEGAVFEEFARICRANGIDRTRPLSASAYDRWRVDNRAEWRSVGHERLPNGQAVLTLKATVTSPAKDRISEAALLLREEDSHPVGERLKVNSVEYEISEDVYKIVEIASIPRSPIESSRSLAAPPDLPAAALQPTFEISAALPPAPPVPAELAAAAVEVHFVLHRLGFCQNELLEINRDRERIGSARAGRCQSGADSNYRQRTRARASHECRHAG